MKKGVQAECAARVAAYFQIACVLNSGPLIFLISTYVRNKSQILCPVSVDFSLEVGRRGVETAETGDRFHLILTPKFSV